MVGEGDQRPWGLLFLSRATKKGEKNALYATVRLYHLKKRSLSERLFLVIDLIDCDLVLVEAAACCALLSFISPPGYVA